LPFLNINSDASVQLTNKLEKLHRSALPVAIRQTLTNTARDVKTKSILEVTDKEFTNRQKNFFKAFTGFTPARGFNVDKMSAVVGIFHRGNQSAKDLEKQEFGGKIKGRSFIPKDEARVSKSNSKKISKAKALGKFKNMPKIGWGNKKNFRRKTKRLKVGKAFAYGNTVFLIKKKEFKSGSGIWLTTEKIWTYKSGRSANISKPTHFMKKSAFLSRKKMPSLYKIEAERQINKSLRK